MKSRIRRRCRMRRVRPLTRRPMFQLLQNLTCTKRKELIQCLLRLHARQACDELPERPHGVGLRVRRRVLVDDLQHEVKEGVGEVETDDVESIFDGFEYAFFLFATCGVALPAFLWEVFV